VTDKTVRRPPTCTGWTKKVSCKPVSIYSPNNEADFLNSFTGTFCGKLAKTLNIVKYPTALNCVARLYFVKYQFFIITIIRKNTYAKLISKPIFYVHEKTPERKLQYLQNDVRVFYKLFSDYYKQKLLQVEQVSCNLSSALCACINTATVYSEFSD